MNPSNIRFGTCTWNYPSWVGLCYTQAQTTAAAYLTEYAKHFRTVEIDSWFYRIPERKEVQAYKAAVDSDFRFTCKIPQEITLTHLRSKSKSDPLTVNPDFLSKEKFNRFLDVVSPLLDQIDAVMFEFEYLNKQKMSSQGEFLDRIDSFIKELPADLPYALEPRNGNYLNEAYFKFISEHKLIHVFSEKLYMPHVYFLYSEFKKHLHLKRSVIRLLGGDRKAMEEKTKEQWNMIVEPKMDLPSIAGIIGEMSNTQEVVVNVNNHYEGSAPLTIRSIQDHLKK